jgi:hypothetical protein
MIAKVANASPGVPVLLVKKGGYLETVRGFLAEEKPGHGNVLLGEARALCLR